MIDFEKIKEYNNEYNSNAQNKHVETDITNNGIFKACMNNRLELDNNFNLEIKGFNVYNQLDSYSCWAYAGINFIKPRICEQLKISQDELDLSIPYIIFFTRLEKLNYIYESYLNHEITIENIKKDNILNSMVNTYGNFDIFVSIVNKYGLVPENSYKTSKAFYTPFIIDKILKQKVISDIKRMNKNPELLEKINEENYTLLSKLYGVPPIDFKYKGKVFTPQTFKEEYLKINLEDYITICNDPTLEIEKEYISSEFKCVYNEQKKFINTSIQKMKQLVLKQLKDNVPVWFGCDLQRVGGCVSNHRGILDTNLYDYENILNLISVDKEDNYVFGNSSYDHAMLITGVQIENDIPIRWKVLNTFGEENNINGYFIMTDAYFEKYVTSVVINKKYL